MTRLQELFDEQGQSPWLGNLTRPYLRDGTLARSLEDHGVAGFHDSFAHVLAALEAKAAQLARR